ncbi:hypothetical protein DM02DRAFT_586838 [Periconia macrospinosa]|uniref:ER-bound oxygenase mpaB/mpaB'/Rubber oxygenase catalytic domain-containing protein n=1 Tax=Periconia macrospinosa TaxID=97972 RepID=A0A2V1E0F8_9PLEO|nr:hypothetical protein DM02DRAFT_586838 [Periconia macrospinosa]
MDYHSIIAPVLAILVICYLILVRRLRYARIESLQKQYGRTPAEFANLGYKDAQAILGQLGLYESPWLFLAGKDFAFLRAFAIPSISKVSVNASEMVHRVGKRYADTTVLVGEFLVNELDSPRAVLAINRMNWIHSRYGSSIEMPQMVYTLCLLVCEALLWVDRFDWRPTTPLEKHASWVFWSEVGRRMRLVGVPESFEECVTYVEEYEKKEMTPSKHNAKIKEGVYTLYASSVPKFLAPVVHLVLDAFMDSRLSDAFMLKERTWHTDLAHTVVRAALALRKYIVRHTFLPRNHTFQVFGDADADGFRSMSFWEIEPWYVPAEKSGSWLRAAYVRIFGLPRAGDDKYRPQGYKLHEIGPKGLEGRGGEEVLGFVEQSGSCAFSTFGQFGKRGECYYVPKEKQPELDMNGGGGMCPMGFSVVAGQ